MEQGISEIFGEGTGGNGEGVPIYRALRTLLGSACGSPIPPGGLFTRKAVPGFGARILPRCGKCAPFEFKEKGAAEGATLIEKLLSPEPEARNRMDEPRRDVSEEAARRLGPALSRSRRKPD